MEARGRAPRLPSDERGEAGGRAPAELDVALAADVGASGVARSLIKLELSHYLSAREHFVIELLTSELVNNAVLHGGGVMTGQVGLRVDVGHERIRVEVRDAGLGFRPVEPDRAPGTQGGFGLVLVNDLATRWDVDVTGGTCVWFELERAHIASPPDRAVEADIPDGERDIASELAVVKERLALLEAQLAARKAVHDEEELGRRREARLEPEGSD